MYIGYIHLLILLCISNSIQTNGKYYTNFRSKYKSILDIIKNYTNVDSTLVCVFGVSNSDISINKQYGFKFTDSIDDNCESLQKFVNTYDNSTNPLHVVDGIEDVNEHGIFVIDKLPSEAEVAELVTGGGAVSVALTACPFVRTQPPKSKTEEEEDEEIRVSSLQIEQITVILSIFFVVFVGALFMINISTPNSVKQNIKIAIN